MAKRITDGHVTFRAQLADGRTLTGAIQGRGGRIGGGSAHAGHYAAHAAAWAELQQAIWAASEGTVSPLSEPEPGHCWLIPSEHERDGTVDHWVPVPLLTTRFEMLLDGEPVAAERLTDPQEWRREMEASDV